MADKENKTQNIKDLKIETDRYRVFIEDVTDGFFETNLNGHFTFFNNALCRIFGYTKNEIQNRNFRDFMDEKNARIAFDHFNEIYRTGKGVSEILWEINRKDHEIRIIEASANLIVDDFGNKLGFRGIARDVTEKYLAQQAIKKSEQCMLNQYKTSYRSERRYRALLDFLPDPVFVLNLDSTVSYLNPAFVKVFGWTLEDLKGKRIPFVPEELKEQTRQGTRSLFKEKIIHGFETKRKTNDGRIRDVVLDASIFYEKDDQPTGQVIILRDTTKEKRIERSNQALFLIAKALPRYQRLNDLLDFIVKEIQTLISVEGASVILVDEKKKEFFFPVAVYDDSEAGKKMKEIRFPLDEGVAGYVYRIGQPLIVPDTSKSPHFFNQVDDKAGYKTRSMLDVPIKTQDRIIGVLCAVNKKSGEFDPDDVELLSAIASTVALPIENARINEALTLSYKDVKSLNRAKDRVIHHLSHELKTPVSVLSASLGLLKKRIQTSNGQDAERIIKRAQRNLNRLLDMQYEIEDILRQKKYFTYHMLSILLDVCMDELELLSIEEFGDNGAVERIRKRVEDIFGPRDLISEKIQLDQFARETIKRLSNRFAHRKCVVEINFSKVVPILIPSEVLEKIIEGLLRNAIENTPEQGKIIVTVSTDKKRPCFTIQDFGVGITDENQRLIFENYFTGYETMHYSSRNAYDFNAGGKGFDLIRMKIFSERYHFNIHVKSRRCRFIIEDIYSCPGKIELCDQCRSPEDCYDTGGTTITLRFKSKK